MITAIILTGLGIQPVHSATVNINYIKKTYPEIHQYLGSYTAPTIYINKPQCGETAIPDAYACDAYTIAVGTRFLQSQEDQHGKHAAKMIIAHEWGHTIQFSRNTQQRHPYMELQADCAGGSFIGFAVKNLGYSSFLEAAVSSARAAADFRVHGSPAQRDYYTRWGYSHGIQKCLNRMPHV